MICLSVNGRNYPYLTIFTVHARNFCDFVDSNFGNYSGIVGLLKLHAGTGYVSQVNDASLAH